MEGRTQMEGLFDNYSDEQEDVLDVDYSDLECTDGITDCVDVEEVKKLLT